MTNPGKPGALSAQRTLRRQHGVISRRQALAAGLTNDMVQHRIRAGGPWQRLLPGVYLTMTGAPTSDQRDTAALLYAGPGAGGGTGLVPCAGRGPEAGLGVGSAGPGPEPGAGDGDGRGERASKPDEVTAPD